MGAGMVARPAAVSKAQSRGLKKATEISQASLALPISATVSGEAKNSGKRVTMLKCMAGLMSVG